MALVVGCLKTICYNKCLCRTINQCVHSTFMRDDKNERNSLKGCQRNERNFYNMQIIREELSIIESCRQLESIKAGAFDFRSTPTSACQTISKNELFALCRWKKERLVFSTRIKV